MYIHFRDSLKSLLVSAITQERLVIPNKYGEKLVGVLEGAGSKKLVILCHGLQSSKEETLILNLAAGLTGQGFSIFRFDFSGNGESEGEFQFGNYRKEADDLHAVVLYLSGRQYEISAIVGHSKGATSVLLYSSTYNDVFTFISASGRFALDRGIENWLGEGFKEIIEKDGFIDVKDRTGKVKFRVTKESLMERLSIDIRSECLSISKDCRFLIVHGTSDEAIPVEDAFELAKHVPNNKLHIIEGASHCYTDHQEEWVSAVVDFLKSEQV